jgi:hypothetical protein
VLLVGDAAAQLPPTGGFGVNTGIQGLHNLVWKLALVRAGVASPALLDTYETERRAVARYNVERSLENSRMVERINAAARGETRALSPSEAVAASRRYGNFLGMELGYRYDSAAIVADGSEPDRVEDEVIDYVPSARPGKRAPHVWIERAGRRISVLDLFGPHFTLLVGRGGARSLQAAVETARGSLGVPLETHALGTDFEDPDGRFAERYAPGSAGAVLVRPDGHVGFRGGAGGLDAALRQILVLPSGRDGV